jgi:O-antigen/teichoic acid export membrane protein
MTHPFDRWSVLRSVLMVTGSTYVNYIVGLVTSTLIARGLGPADFGRYSYLVWLSGVLILLSTNGLTTSGIRFISESIGRGNKAAARDINGWLLRRHYISLMLVTVGFALLMPWLEPAGWQANLWTFAWIVLVSSAAKADYLFYSSIAKGYGIFGVES